MKKLGFGLMRLPKINGEIDIEQVKIMADDFLSNGFTYFDTAYVYENSEVAFKEAVVKRYNRSDYYIADKLTAWKLKEGSDKEEIFKESLDRLGIEYIDYYLLHAVRLLEFLSRTKKERFNQTLWLFIPRFTCFT